MIIKAFEGINPHFGERVFLAENVVIIGDVRLGDDVSIWYGCVLRGDIHHIEIGARSNLQDGVIVHVERGLYSTVLDEEVTVGHGAILHGCRIGRGALIGMGACILNDAEIGAGAIVAAGTVVREGFKVPPNTLVAGVPGKIKRELGDEEREHLERYAPNYLEYKSRHMAESGRAVMPPESDR